jgi:hypothetical protein
MHIAAAHGSYEITKVLIQHGAGIDTLGEVDLNNNNDID